MDVEFLLYDSLEVSELVTRDKATTDDWDPGCKTETTTIQDV